MKQKQSLIDMPEIVIRDKNNIDDYLYEPNSKYSNKEAEKMFDYIDIVFMDGEGTILPWSWKYEKLARLYKMCKLTNKCLFAGSFGMQMLIYFCATSFANLKIINGNGKGGSLQQIQEINAKLLPLLEKGQVYLDNLTGDYYIYDQKLNQWKPKGNVGLHYSRAMASLGGITGGDLIKKVTTYTEKNNYNKPVLFYSKLTDVKCSIKKQYISHPLLQGVPQEFVVENRNTWDPHPVNITNIQLVETNYDTLAESERGPQIAVHQNTVAVQFHIDNKYKESVQVLTSYVAIKLGQFQQMGKIDLTLDQAYLKQRQMKFNPMDQPINSHKDETIDILDDYQSLSGSISTVKNSKQARPLTAVKKLQFTKDFQHSGLGYSKRRGAVIVDNNAVSQNSIQATTVKEQYKRDFNRSHSRQILQSTSNQNNSTIKNNDLLPSSSTPALTSQRTQFGMSSQINLITLDKPFTLGQIGFKDQSKRPLSGIFTRNPSAKGPFRVTFNEEQQQKYGSNQSHILISNNNTINQNTNNTTTQSNQLSFKSQSQTQQSFSQNSHREIQSKPKSTLRHLRNYQIEKEFKEQLKGDADKYLWKNQKEIRQMLHPTLCEEFLPEDRDMNTKQGLLSATKSSSSLIAKNVLNQTPSRKVFSRFKDFKQMPQYDMDKPIIRNASPYIGCEEEQIRLKERFNTQRRINTNDFKTSFGRATTNNNNNYIKNYVTADPSQPPLLHKFREESKDNWIKGTFKF